MALEPYKLFFRPNEQVSSFDHGQGLQTDTYFSENSNGANMPTKKKMIHLEGHVCIQGVVIGHGCMNYSLKA